MQVAVLPISEHFVAYAESVTAALTKLGLRVETDLRNEKIGYKIRAHTLRRVPYMLVVGEREQEAGTVALRDRNGQDLGSHSVAALGAALQKMVEERQNTLEWQG